MLQHDVLEATSGASQRHLALPCMADGFERALCVAIRGRGRNEHSRESFDLIPAARPHLVGGDPLEGNPKVLESRVGGQVRGVLRVVIADNSDHNSTFPYASRGLWMLQSRCS